MSQQLAVGTPLEGLHTPSQPARRPVMTDLRVSNQRRNIEEFASRSATVESKPLIVFLELTQNCNLSCPMCRSAGKYIPDWNMTPELYERVMEELFATALIVDLRGWGESTIVRGFSRYVSDALATGVRLRLVTNGQVNRPDVWEQMMSADSIIAISCDAADEELFATLRAGGTVSRLRKTAAAIVAERDRQGAPRESVSLTVAVSRPNLADLPNILAMAAELGITQVTLFPIQIELTHPWHLRGDLEGTRQALDAVQSTAVDRGIEVTLGAAMDPALTFDDDVKSLCMHPWAYCYVSYDGRVGFCDHLIGNPQYTLGSLRSTPFTDIWNGEDFRRLREAHLQHDIPDRFFPCRWCYKQRYIDFEFLAHPSYAEHVVSTSTRPKLHCSHDVESRQPLPFLP